MEWITSDWDGTAIHIDTLTDHIVYRLPDLVVIDAVALSAKPVTPTRTLSSGYPDLQPPVSRSGVCVWQAESRHMNSLSSSRSSFKLRTGPSAARQAVRTLKLNRESSNSRYEHRNTN